MAKLIFTEEDLFTGSALLRSRPRFTPGFDKMTPEAAETWLKINGERLCHALNAGKYRAMPAIGFNVAKLDGSYRRLARLTAIDTIVQNVILEKLSEECAKGFSPYSFAYQKGKGTGAALHRFCECGSEHPYAAKTDPRACFDHIDLDVLEQALLRFFFHRKTVALLMECARMPVIVEGELTERSRGVLQGAPLSGMLCNIYFHSLDQALEERGIPFIRYADDIVAFGDTPRQAEDAGRFIRDWLENKLRLRINREKSRTDAAENLRFLGHTFLRDKNGAVQFSEAETDAAVYHEWYGERPRSHKNSIDVLSDGILRQRDYAALFSDAAGDTSIPLDTVERINVFSSVIFDSGFLEKAMRAGVYINVFNKDYSPLGRFVPFGPIRAQSLIFEQLSAYNDPTRRLALAKEFDLASIHNLRLNIRYYNKQHEQAAFKSALSGINRLYGEMKNCSNYDDLLLKEARVRELYYGCFDLFIRNEAFVFQKRSRRPPLNEVNSMLSFCNIVLYNYIATEILKSSLDIRVGFLHATNRRLESLNLDIAEIFRPLLTDRIVFTAVNRKEIGLSHFMREKNGGVYLNAEGKKLLLRRFYEKLSDTLLIGDAHVSYAMLIDSEIQKLTRYFRSGEAYKAFRQVR